MTRQAAMKFGFLLIALIASALFLYSPRITAGQQAPLAVEVQLPAPTFQDVLNELFGGGGFAGLLNGTQPFEFRAENVMLTPQQAQNFFAPGSPMAMGFAALVAAVEKLPGTEVKIQGFVDGAPFQLKIEAGEVKVQGLMLTQAQLNALADRLQMIAGIREVKIGAIVNGQPVRVKIENGVREIEAKHERGEHGRHEARDRDRDGDREHKVERGAMTERMRHPERVERAERVERVERVERMERPERMERSGRN